MANNQEPKAKSQEPKAKSQEPKAKSQEPRAKSQEPRAKASSQQLSLLHIHQFNVEHQSGIGRNGGAGAARAVTQLGRDTQLSLAPDFHSGNAFVPSFNHLPDAQLELDGLARVA